MIDIPGIAFRAGLDNIGSPALEIFAKLIAAECIKIVNEQALGVTEREFAAIVSSLIKCRIGASNV